MYEIIDSIGQSRGIFGTRREANAELRRLALVGARVKLKERYPDEPSDASGYSEGCESGWYED